MIKPANDDQAIEITNILGNIGFACLLRSDEDN